MEKNKPFKGSTKDWKPDTTTVTGQFPNRYERRKQERLNKKQNKSKDENTTGENTDQN